MRIISGNTLDEAINSMKSLRTYRPYEYSGTWFLAMIQGECHAYRTKNSLVKKASMAGIHELEIAKVS